MFRTTLTVVVQLSVKILPTEDESGERAMGTRAIGNLLTAHCKALILRSIISIILDFKNNERQQFTRGQSHLGSLSYACLFTPVILALNFNSPGILC